MKNIRMLYASFFILVNTTGCLSLKAQEAMRYEIIKPTWAFGKAFSGVPNFHRVDTARYPDLPKDVKHLLTNSTGLYIRFRTSSNTISAKWCTSKERPGNNVTGIMMEGIDLYIQQNDQWKYAGVGRPKLDSCSQWTIVSNMQPGMKECWLNLPLYDELQELEVGVEEGAIFEIIKPEQSSKRRIAVYGSSITQGASASRPGLAYPAVLTRLGDLEFINLGLSGSGKMELSAARMLADMDVEGFIMDCVPNPTLEEIEENVIPFINMLRAKHPLSPIVAIDRVISESANFDTVNRTKMRKQNELFKKKLKMLQEKDKQLFLLELSGKINDVEGAYVDGVHPNDLGMSKMIEEIKPYVMDHFK